MSNDNSPAPRATPVRLDQPGVQRNRLIAKAKAAIGKAFIVYLATGSLGAAVVAFIIFKAMGC
jgi:hypothetical protein